MEELFYWDDQQRQFRPVDADTAAGPRFVYDQELGTYVPAPGEPPAEGTGATAHEAPVVTSPQPTGDPELVFATTEGGLAHITRVTGEGDDATSETTFGRVVVRGDGALAFEEAEPTKP